MTVAVRFRGVVVVEESSTTTTTSSGSAPTGADANAVLSGVVEAAREATRAQNLAGAQRLRAANGFVEEFARQERARDAADEAAGRPARPGYARLDPRSRARDQVAAACAVTCWHATRMVTAGVQIHTRLPRVLSMTELGRLPEQLVVDVACRLATVDDAIIAEVEAQVLARIAGPLSGGDRLSRPQVDAIIDQEVEDADPEAARAAAEAAEQSRTVRFRPERNGMARLWALLPASKAELLRIRIDAEARAAAGDGVEGTMDQLRADVLASYAAYPTNSGPASSDSGSPDSASPGEVDGIELGEVRPGADLPRPSLGNTAASGGQPVGVTVIAATTSGQADRVEFARGAYASFDWLCRELLEGEDSRVRFNLVDSAPGAMDSPQHALRYQLSQAMIERIRLRDGTCRHPGCQVEARHCDVDHVIAFNQDMPEYGGPSLEWNLMCLCRRHHREKTFGTSTYRPGPLGELIITTSSGHNYHTQPSGPLARARDGIQERIWNIVIDRLTTIDGNIANPPGVAA